MLCIILRKIPILILVETLNKDRFMPFDKPDNLQATS